MALRLCCRLENAANVANPEVGVGGAEVGAPTYPPAKYGNGILSDIDNEGCTFPTGANNINLDKGTLEFWGKMLWDENAVAHHYIFSFYASGDGGIYLLFNASTHRFTIVVYSGGVQILQAHTAGVTWDTNDCLHFGIAWDRTGAEIGASKTIILKIDDVEEASSTTTWDAGVVGANLLLGTSRTGIMHSDVVIDQVKTYDTCKIDFSDRNTEHCNGNNPPTAPTGQQVDGQSAPTGANCISDLTPGFTAIFNDPDAGDQANAIEIQVGTASGLSDMWDSGWIADSTTEGNRCTAKTYDGAALSPGTSYWWRCRFRDDDDAEGAWSAWQQFDMCAALNLVQMALI